MRAHRSTTFEIEDFGENYHIERKREHQTYYFCEIGVSLYGCMLRIRVEDLSDAYLGPGEKQKLLQFFSELGKLPIVLIAHIIISEDLAHDNAFVQHVNSRIIWEWLKKVTQHPSPATGSHSPHNGCLLTYITVYRSLSQA